MQNTSALYNSILAGNHSFEVRAIAGNNIYTHADMYSMTENNTLFSALSIGNCISRKLELVLYNAVPANLQTITPQIRVVNESQQSEWINKGTFLVDTITSSPLTTNTVVTAYDAMLKANVIYFKTGSWAGKTGIEVVDDIAIDIGVTVESNTRTIITNAAIAIDYIPVSGEKGTTEREMLSYIAMMCGGNFYINDNNELQLVLLDPIVADDIDLGQSYVALSISNTETVVGVRMWIGDDTYYYAPSSLTVEEWEALVGDKIECECPYADQTIVDTLYQRLSGMIYQPYSLRDAFINPAAELGDSICVNAQYHVYLADQTLYFNQLAQSDLSADATKSIDSMYPMIEPIKREVTKVSAGIRTRLQVTEDMIIAEVIRATNAENEHATEQAKYIKYSEAGLELGTEGSQTKAVLTDTKLAFVDPTGDEKAFIGQDPNDDVYKFYVINGHIVNKLELGDHWDLVASGSDNENRLTIRWRG